MGAALDPGQHHRSRVLPERDHRDLYADDRGSAWLRRNTPLPSEGTVDDFLGGVLWLASDAGRYVTGQTILVDGGWTAR